MNPTGYLVANPAGGTRALHDGEPLEKKVVPAKHRLTKVSYLPGFGNIRDQVEIRALIKKQYNTDPVLRAELDKMAFFKSAYLKHSELFQAIELAGLWEKATELSKKNIRRKGLGF